MTEFSKCNSISLKSYVWFPDFLAEHQWKSANWIPIGNEHDFSMIFQRQYSTNTLLKRFRYQLCCFLLLKISVSPSSSYSWTWWLTGDWRNWHHPHDCSFPSSNLSCLRAFLNKKALVSCKLIPCTDNVCCVTLINTQSCLMDTVMAGCAEHAHQLICVDMTCAI